MRHIPNYQDKRGGYDKLCRVIRSLEEAQRIMLSNNLLEVGKSSASNDVSNMERKQYLVQIHELVQAVQTLLDANIALGNKQKEQKAESDRKIADLQEQVDKLTGELQANGSTGFLQGIL